MISRAARFSIAALVAAADRLSKYWIEANVTPWDTHPVIPGIFNIVHTQNKGAAFGMLASADGAWRMILLVGVALAVMAFVAVQLWRMPRGGWPPTNLVAVPLSMMLGGAAGNLYDRIFRGSVTDFLQVFIGSYEWPSFNVADSAISVGAVLLLVSFWRPQPQPAN
jgi:signal peptidase II